MAVDVQTEITEVPVAVPTPARYLPNQIHVTIHDDHSELEWDEHTGLATDESILRAICARVQHRFHLASVTTDEAGGIVRIIPFTSWDAPILRYQIDWRDAYDEGDEYPVYARVTLDRMRDAHTPYTGLPYLLTKKSN